MIQRLAVLRAGRLPSSANTRVHRRKHTPGEILRKKTRGPGL